MSGIALLAFLILEAVGVIDNPYVGIIGLAFLPAVFVAGLIAMPVGIFFRRRKLLKSDVSLDEVSAFPRLDFNDAHVRRATAIVIGLTVVNAILLATSTATAVSFMDTPKFCGTVCHKVMQPEYTAYQNSPHSRVKCVQCHIGPGASFAVRSKFDGLRQVWKVLIPEIPYDLDVVAEVLRRRSKNGKRFSIICVSEGTKPKGGDVVVARRVETSPDPIRLGGIANKLVVDIEERTKLDVRATVLGHIQRGGSPTPADRVLATQFGHHALEILMAGAQGQLVVQQNGRLGEVPIQSVAGKQRKVTLDDPLVRTARAVGTCFGD